MHNKNESAEKMSMGVFYLRRIEDYIKDRQLVLDLKASNCSAAM